MVLAIPNTKITQVFQKNKYSAIKNNQSWCPSYTTNGFLGFYRIPFTPNHEDGLFTASIEQFLFMTLITIITKLT